MKESSIVKSAINVSSKIFGREREISLIAKSIKSSRDSGGKNSIFIVGPSGIGKTRTVMAALETFEQDEVLILATKYDQLAGDSTGETLTNVIRAFFANLLTLPSHELLEWKNLLRDHLGHNAKVISDVIGELELILEDVVEPPALGINESQTRFELTLVSLLKFICERSKKTIVVFVDDLQWTSARSISLLSKLIETKGLKNFCFIGAYRDSIGDDHPIYSVIDNESIDKEVVVLGGLTASNIHSFLCEILKNKEISSKYSQDLLAKTDGNPFHLIQYILYLEHKEVLVFSEGQWRIDEELLSREGVAPNVMELLLTRFQMLSDEDREFLSACSVLGNQVEIETLSSVLETSQEEIIGRLEKFSSLNYLKSISKKFLVFTHDRIQEAAYKEASLELKNRVHLRAGGYLLDRFEAQGEEDDILSICYHFKHGPIVSDIVLKKRLAEINILAAEKSISSANFKIALDHIKNAFESLGLFSYGDPIFNEILLKKAELLYLNGLYDDCEKFIMEWSRKKDHSPEIRANLLKQLAIQYTAQGKYSQAIEAGRKALAELDLELPEEDLEAHVEGELEAVFSRTKDIELMSLESAGEMTDGRMRLIVDILINMDSPCYLSNIELYNIIVSKMVAISIDYGPVPASAKAYASFGIVLCSYRKYHLGRLFCELGVAVARRFDHLGQLCRACHTMANHVQYWTQHIKEGDAFNEEGFVAGHDCGEYLWAGFIKLFKPYNQFFRARNLKELMRDVESGLAYCEEHPNQLGIDTLSGLKLIIESLTFDNLDSRIVQNKDQKFIENCHKTNSLMALSMYLSVRAFVLILEGRFGESREVVRESVALNRYSNAVITNFYDSFCICFLLIEEASEYRDIDFKLFNEHYSLLEDLAIACEDNFGHFKFLIDGEIKILQGEFYEGIELLEKASKIAIHSGFSHVSALINRRFSDHWRAQKSNNKISSFYLESMRKELLNWGATSLAPMASFSGAKVPIGVDLRDEFKDLLSSSDKIVGVDEILGRSLDTIFGLVKNDVSVILKFQESDFDIICARGVLDFGACRSLINYSFRTKKPLNTVEDHVSSIQDHINRLESSYLIYPFYDDYVLVLERKWKGLGFEDYEVNVVEMFLQQLSLSMKNIDSTKKLSQFNSELENKVLERTIQLKNERDKAHEILSELKQTQRDLVLAARDSGRSEIAANVIHNIGNSSMYVLGQVEVLKEKIKEDTSHLALTSIADRMRGFKGTAADFVLADDVGRDIFTFIDEIDKLNSEFREDVGHSLDKIHSKLSQIMSLLKNEKGFNKSYSVREYVDVKKLIMDAASLAQVPVECLTVQVSEISQQPAVDIEKVKNILINLLSNSIRATEGLGGGRSILATCRKNGSWLEFRVSDNGVGIHEGILGQIFNPGFTTKPGSEDGGHGLHNSSVVAQNLGGKIVAESGGVNMGATFTLSLPWHDSPS